MMLPAGDKDEVDELDDGPTIGPKRVAGIII